MAEWAIRATSRSNTSTATTAATASPKAARKSRSGRWRGSCSAIWARGNISTALSSCRPGLRAGTHNPGHLLSTCDVSTKAACTSRNHQRHGVWVPDQRSRCSLVRDDETIQSQTPVRRVGKAQACPPFLFCTRWWARRDAPLPTLQITGHTSAFSPRAAPEVCVSLSLKQEGAGNAGCALHPRSRVQRVERKAHTSIQGSGGNPTFPAQWLYGLFRAHPGVSGFPAPVASRKPALRPGRAFAPPLRLDANH